MKAEKRQSLFLPHDPLIQRDWTKKAGSSDPPHRNSSCAMKCLVAMRNERFSDRGCIPGRRIARWYPCSELLSHGIRCAQLNRILRTSPSGIVDHAASLSKTIVWQRSGSVGSQVKPGWLGLPVRAKVGPGRGHLLGQRLRLRRVASALFAALGVVEAEGELGGVPCARILQHGRLPGEVVRDRPARLSGRASAWPCARRCCAWRAIQPRPPHM